MFIFASKMNTRIGNKLKASIDKLKSKNEIEYYNELKKTIPTVTLEQCKRIYEYTVSFRNSNVSVVGRIFENIIEDELKNAHMNYMSQVSLDMTVQRFRQGKKEPVIDFVVRLDEKPILGSHVSECILISCKHTCRERWKQDNALWEIAKKYILCVGSNDYPSHFMDTNKSVLIVLANKKNDKRKTFDDFLSELKIEETRVDVQNDIESPPITQITSCIKYIDLCCGIGSFHYSMKRNFPNSKCILASDILKDAVDTYALNYGVTPEGDLKSIDYGRYDADVVFSGNPCQSFSQIGKHGGLDDDRGNLFIYIIDHIVALQKYPIFVFENVTGLITHDGGNTFKTIRSKINSYGYNLAYRILLCSDYGIPQNRKRVFIVCSNKHSSDHLEKVFTDTLNDEKPKGTTNLTEYLNNGHLFQRKIAYTIRCGGLKSPISSRQNWDGYYVDGNEEYRLTVNDMKKLQGFAEDFQLCGKASTLLGNTIPTNLSSILAKVVGKLCLS